MIKDGNDCDFGYVLIVTHVSFISCTEIDNLCTRTRFLDKMLSLLHKWP